MAVCRLDSLLPNHRGYWATVYQLNQPQSAIILRLLVSAPAVMVRVCSPLPRESNRQQASFKVWVINPRPLEYWTTTRPPEY